MVPVQFFQVAATAIPTLMIALFIGAKNGEQIAKRMSESGRVMKSLSVFFVLFLVGFILFGELTSLLGVVSNGLTTEWADIIVWVIFVMLFVLSFELIDPIARVFSRRGRWPLYIGVLVMFYVATTVTDHWFQLFRLSHPVP